MAEDRDLTPEEEKALGVFMRLMGYKDVSLRIASELERERQKNVSLQAELHRTTKSCGERILELKSQFREFMNMRDRREAILEDELQEARRELTELATRVSFIKEAADEAENAAVAARHAPPTPPKENEITRGMERELGDLIGKGEAKSEVHVPPVAEMRPRQNMAQRFMDEREEDDVPEVLLRGPMSPEEREQASKSNNPLKDLADTLKHIVSPSTAPERLDQTASEIMAGERR